MSLCADVECRLLKTIAKMIEIKNEIITLYFIAQSLNFLYQLLISTVPRKAIYALFIVLLISLSFLLCIPCARVIIIINDMSHQHW